MLLIARRMGAEMAIPFATMTKADVVKGGWRVTTADGEIEEVSDLDWEIAMNTTVVSTFPAAPGTSVVMTISDPDNGTGMMRTTVLGWGMYADGRMRPITLDDELEEKYFVEHPDGHVESSHDLSRWPNVDHWLEDQKKKGA